MAPGDLKRAFLCLAAVNVVFLGIYLAGAWIRMPWPVQRLFDLNAEATLVAWYSGSLLLLGGVLLLLAGVIGGRNDRGMGWLLIPAGSIGVFLSADEVAAIHEQVTSSLREYRALPRFDGEHGIWVPIYAVAGLMLFAVSLPLWRRLRALHPRGTRLLALGSVLLAAAVFAEVVSYAELRDPGHWLAYRVQVTVEEGLEIFGATLLLLGAADILKATGPGPAWKAPE